MDLITELNFNFTPRAYQQPVFDFMVNQGGKYGIIVWPRGHGKDRVYFTIVLYQAMQRVAQYIYAFPYLGQARTALWDTIDADGKRPIDYIPKELLFREPNQTRMEIVLRSPYDLSKPGSIIKLVGTNDGGLSQRGPNYAGVVLSEAAFMKADVQEVFSGRLAQNNGWLLLNSTVNGRNWFYDAYQKNRDAKNTFTQYLTHLDCTDDSGNLIISQESADNMVRSGQLSEAGYKRELLNDWDAGDDLATFRKPLAKAVDEGRISADLKVIPNIPVQTFWDIGVNSVSGRTAIWFVQLHPNDQIHFLDYYESYDEPTSHYTNYIHKWAQERTLMIGKQFLPHDAAKRSLTDTKLDTYEQKIKMASLGSGTKVIPRIKEKVLAFDETHKRFRKYWFHLPDCDYGVEMLRIYRGNVGGTLSKVQSHCIDAFLAVGQHLAIDDKNNSRNYKPGMVVQNKTSAFD
jgi:hypothetical protein